MQSGPTLKRETLRPYRACEGQIALAAILAAASSGCAANADQDATGNSSQALLSSYVLASFDSGTWKFDENAVAQVTGERW
jgi:hypothetical protein